MREQAYAIMQMDPNWFEHDINYWDQPTIVYHCRPMGHSYEGKLNEYRIGITGANTFAIDLRLKDYRKKYNRVMMDILGWYPNRFEALCKEFELRPDFYMAWNHNPGGIRGYHFENNN